MSKRMLMLRKQKSHVTAFTLHFLGKWAVGVMIMLSLISLTCGCAGSHSSTSAQMDVLFIAIDDLNDWVGFLGGHPQAQTPNLDRLAAQSIIFEKAYCPAPVCNPSRTAILTGMRPSSTGVYGNNDFFREAPSLAKAMTMPQWFAQHGYYTTQRGKIFHHPEGHWADTISWEKHVHLTGKGMQKHPKRTGTHLANGMPYTTVFHTHFDWSPYPDATTSETSDYQTAQWAASVLNQDHDRPLFLACGLFRPHLPWFVPQEYYDLFPLDSVIVPPILETDLEDLPPIAIDIAGGKSPQKDWMRVDRFQKQREAVQGYLAAIAYADDCLGVILDGLERSGKAAQTVIVLWGDHGWHLGEKLHYRKFTLWEEACRVPLLIKVPGLTGQGGKTQGIVNLLDLYPTLTEVCSLPHNPACEGRSLLPLLTQPDTSWSDPTVTTLGPGNHGVVDSRWRLIQYADGSQELYDHQSDPQEWNNLVGDTAYQQHIKRLSSAIPTQDLPPISGSDDLRGAEQDKIVSQPSNLSTP